MHLALYIGSLAGNMVKFFTIYTVNCDILIVFLPLFSNWVTRSLTSLDLLYTMYAFMCRISFWEHFEKVGTF